MEAERAERDGNLQRVAEIRYGEIPALERELAQRNAPENPLVKEEVDEDDVAAVVARWSGIPVERLLEGETEKLIQMEARLHRRVIGQEEAVSAVANALRRARTGLQDPNRPIGSFVFLGPTGVGKTELARALAEFMFDDEHAMVRLDMSEYQERHAVSRLVGAPPGYVGYDEGGQLTEAVRRRPYSVVLLDEIEKSHAEVFDVLLQVLDDGRLTDGQGRTVDFRNTVLIMTSNIRSAEQMREHFRPEFLNRIDEIVEFTALSREQLGEIVELQLARLRSRLAERGLELELSDAAEAAISEEGWDPVYGARPLKRAIQRLLENPLALRLLEGEFVVGDRIVVDAADGELSFARAEPARPRPPEADAARRPQRRSSSVPRVLVVAATVPELAFVEHADTLVCGIGPVEAALATARELERRRPAALLHVGIAGARSFPTGSLVLGSQSLYCDFAAPGLSLPQLVRVEPDPGLLARARRALPAARVTAIATSARLGGGSAHEVEAMEGFGVLRAAASAGVPALELRAVSNAFSDPRELWRVDEALAALAAAVSILIGAFDA